MSGMTEERTIVAAIVILLIVAVAVFACVWRNLQRDNKAQRDAEAAIARLHKLMGIGDED